MTKTIKGLTLFAAVALMEAHSDNCSAKREADGTYTVEFGDGEGDG